MDQNPYQSPAADSAAALAAADIRVEGQTLIVRSGAALPHFCVKSNEAVQQQDIQQRRLSWCSPIMGLLILLSGLLFVLIYFIFRKQCTITFGLSSAVRRKYRNRCILKIVAATVLFFALPLSAAIDSTPVIATVSVLFLVAIISLFFGNSPLAITKHRKGEFWISGCSKGFLSRIAT